MPQSKKRIPQSKKKPPNQNSPWASVDCEPADAGAIRALRNGNADEGQQVRALEFILHIICDRNGMSYRPGPGGDRDTAFAEGRRFVGNQIVRLSKIPLSRLKKD